MALLHQHQNAIIQEEKLSNYCLNENHPTGKYKARVFKAIFGISADDSPILKKAIREGLTQNDVTKYTEDKFGRRYTVIMDISIFGNTGTLVTGWIIPKDEEFPRLTSCYLKV